MSPEADVTPPADALPFAKLLTDWEGVRRMALGLLEPVETTAALRIPPGGKNHLHWHLGHLLTSQDYVLQTRAGLPSGLPRGMWAYFRIGSSPDAYDSLAPDWDDLLALARHQSRDFPGRYLNRVGQTLVKPLRLMNISMTTVGEAIPFLLAHEAEHLSRIKSLAAGGA